VRFHKSRFREGNPLEIDGAMTLEVVTQNELQNPIRYKSYEKDNNLNRSAISKMKAIFTCT